VLFKACAHHCMGGPSTNKKAKTTIATTTTTTVTTKTSNSPTRRSKRKSRSDDSNADERGRMWTSKGNKKKKSTSGINESAIEKLFQEIADDDDPNVASMEGISKLGDKLGIDVTEDIRILVLLWKLGANEKPAQISKTEWMNGCGSLGIDSWDKLKTNVLPTLDTGFLDQSEFKDFYKFTFQFNRQGTHRTLEKEMVLALLNLVLKNRIPDDRLESFCAFVETNAGYSRITLDQWTSFLDFCYECEDLSSYDESTSAWPVLIDEYVEYMEEKSKMQTT